MRNIETEEKIRGQKLKPKREEDRRGRKQKHVRQMMYNGIIF